MATMLGSLLISLGLDSGEFRSGLSATEKELRASTKRIENIGKSMGDIGKKLSIAVTLPLAAMAVSSIKAAAESQEAIGQVNAALKSMGDGAQRTSDQLSGLATGIMRKSLYDDDDILRKVTANMLTFGNVASTQFDRAQQAAVDLAARMGTDLQSAALMVGKALNDPVKGINAMKRVGIQFTDQQIAQVEAMAKVGNMAGAQTIMLAELERQFGGSAAAMRAADPFAALQMSWADFQEEIGSKLLPLLPRITEALTSILDAFATLSPGMQTAVIAFGAVAAALGPVMIGIGAMASAMAPFLSVLGAAFAQGGILVAAKAALVGLGAALGPILVPIAALAAAGALIYYNWEKIAPVLKEMWTAIQASLGPALTEILASLKSAMDAIFASGLIDAIGNYGKVMLQAFGGALPGVLRALSGILVGVVQVITDAIKIIVRLFSGDFSGALQAAQDLCKHFVGMIGNFLGGMAQAAIGYVSGMVKGIDEWLGGKLSAIFKSVTDKIDTVKKGFFGLYDAVVGHSYIPDMVDGIAAQMLRLDAVMVDQAGKATSATKQAFQKLAAELQPLLDELFPDAAAMNLYQAKLKKLTDGAKAGLITPELAEAGKKQLGFQDRPTDSAIPLILADPFVHEMSKINEAMDGMKKKAGGATVAIAKTFADMAKDTIGALQSMTSAIKGGGFLDILSAVVGLGLQLGSIGAFGSKIATNINTPRPIKGYANGTNFAPGGMALVGERGPELVNLPRGSQVIPNEALGGSRVEIVPSPYFTAIVDGRAQSAVQSAAPMLIGASVAETGARAARSQSRRVG